MDYTDAYNPNLAYPTAHDMTTVDPVAAAAFVSIMLMFVFIFAIASYVIYSFLLSRIFKKAGVQQWAAWVPVYNSWKMLELGNQQGFWAVLALVPLVNIASLVFMYIAMYHIGKKLGKEDWFVLLAIFLPIVWMIWLGFDDSKWHTAKAAAKKSAQK